MDSSNRVPDGGDTIGRFRNIQIKNNPDQKLFEQVAALPEAKGKKKKKLTLV